MNNELSAKKWFIENMWREPKVVTGGVLWKKLFLKILQFQRKTPALESLFDKGSGLQGCNFIKNRLQHRFFLVQFANCLKTPSPEKRKWLLLRVLKPASCHRSLSTPPVNISLRYFQCVYKETNAIEWVNTSLYKNKAIFVYLSVDQILK